MIVWKFHFNLHILCGIPNTHIDSGISTLLSKDQIYSCFISNLFHYFGTECDQYSGKLFNFLWKIRNNQQTCQKIAIERLSEGFQSFYSETRRLWDQLNDRFCSDIIIFYYLNFVLNFYTVRFLRRDGARFILHSINTIRFAWRYSHDHSILFDFHVLEYECRSCLSSCPKNVVQCLQVIVVRFPVEWNKMWLA